MKILRSIQFLFLVLLTACNVGEYNPPYKYNTNPRYTKGYVEFFGKEYANDYNITNNVVSVSLFSDSLDTDSMGNIIGTGQFLYLEDVIIPSGDTLLPVGIYTVGHVQGLPYTIFEGKNDTVAKTQLLPTGARIFYYEANASKSLTKFITSGTMQVSVVGDHYTISCDFITSDKKSLKGSFYGLLPHYDESYKPKDLLRKKKYLTIF